MAPSHLYAVSLPLLGKMPQISNSAPFPGDTGFSDELHVQLIDPLWALWRQSILRGAGFPVDYPLRLASPDCVAAIEDVLQSELAVQEAKRNAVDLLKNLRSEDPAKRKEYTNAIHHLHAGKIPADDDLPSQVQTAIATLTLACANVDTVHTAYRQVFSTELVSATAALREIVEMDSFRQALAWQNRQALHTCVEPFLSKPPTQHDSHYRQQRSILVKYLQRYSMKNDTIGFFGPVGWAHWSPESATTLQPGPDLLAKRTTYIEGWCVNAISQALTTAHPALLRWAKPRLMPYARVAQSKLYLPFVKPIPLSPAQARVLAACDGIRSAYEIAHQLLQAGIPEPVQAIDVYTILTAMQSSRRITWSFDVSLEDPYPEKALRRNIEQVGDQELRATALATVEKLEQAADAVKKARISTQLDAAIGNFESMFTALTGQLPIRSAGELYAGRTLLYEDSLRDVEVKLGTNVLHHLEGPLTLILASARWLGYQLAQTSRQYFQNTYEKLVQKHQTPVIAFVEYFPWINSQLYEDLHVFIEQAQTLFQQKWSEILHVAGEQRLVNSSYEAIAPFVHAAFDVPGPGWPSAYFHSPDVMFDAENLDAINRGDFHYILGELHLGINTLDGVLFTEQNPQASDMYAAMAQDIPFPLILPLASSQFLPSTRTQQSLALPKDFRLITSTDVCDAPVSQTLRMGDLVVEQIGEKLLVRTYDGHHQFDVLAVFSDYFSVVVGDSFAIFPSQEHTPRLTIDRLVVTRETWRFRADQVPFVTMQDLAECYISVRRWAQILGMPRFLFYRTIKEKKPCYLDLDSPLYVELFVKEVRRTVQSGAPKPGGHVVTLSEMLPTPNHAWLVDTQGAHYASEIRIAAVDKKHRTCSGPLRVS